MKKSVFSKLSFGFLSLITMLIACNTPISSINNIDPNKSKPFKIKGGGRTYIPIPFDTYYISPFDITSSGTMTIHYGTYPPKNIGLRGLTVSNTVISIGGELFSLSGETNITGNKLFLPAHFSSKKGTTGLCGNDRSWGFAWFYDWNLPAQQEISGSIDLSASDNNLIATTSFSESGTGAIFSVWCYTRDPAYKVDGSGTMTIKNIMKTEDSISVTGEFDTINQVSTINLISENISTNLTVTPSNKNRAWSLSITGSNVAYSQNNGGKGDGNILFPSNGSISAGTYKVEVHYNDDPTISASSNIYVLPVASPDPNATITPKATATPTVVSTPTPTPVPPPPPFCGTGKEMVGLKDMLGNPVCCPSGAVCGSFGGTNKKKPNVTPSGSPSTTPSTNPSSNPTVTPSSNSTPNPTSNPDGGAGDGTKKKTGFLIVEDGKEIVSTVVDTKFSVLVTNLEDTDAWMLKLSGSDLVVASGIGSQIVDINSADLNRGLSSGTYLDDGYYDLYLDINPEAKTFIGIDNTPPDIVVDYEKSYFDMSDNLITYVSFVDPVVNGVSSGVDETLSKATEISLSSLNGSINFTSDSGYYIGTVPPLSSPKGDRISAVANSFWVAGFGKSKILESKKKLHNNLVQLGLSKNPNSISISYTDQVKNKIYHEKNYLCK